MPEAMRRTSDLVSPRAIEGEVDLCDDGTTDADVHLSRPCSAPRLASWTLLTQVSTMAV